MLMQFSKIVSFPQKSAGSHRHLAFIGTLAYLRCPSFSIVAWLIAVVTAPATVRYSAIFSTITGKLTGDASKAAPAAASSNPHWLKVLKNSGVGA